MFKTMDFVAGDRVVFAYPDDGGASVRRPASTHLWPGSEYTIKYVYFPDDPNNTTLFLAEAPGIAFAPDLFEHVVDISIPLYTGVVERSRPWLIVRILTAIAEFITGNVNAAMDFVLYHAGRLSLIPLVIISVIAARAVVQGLRWSAVGLFSHDTATTLNGLASLLVGVLVFGLIYVGRERVRHSG